MKKIPKQNNIFSKKKIGFSKNEKKLFEHDKELVFKNKFEKQIKKKFIFGSNFYKIFKIKEPEKLEKLDLNDNFYPFKMIFNISCPYFGIYPKRDGHFLVEFNEKYEIWDAKKLECVKVIEIEKIPN